MMGQPLTWHFETLYGAASFIIRPAQHRFILG
jgi:hypothetical protein